MPRDRSPALMAWALLCLAVAASPAAAREAPLVVEFVHAAAGAGSSSGGHVALRVGERAYHYQRDAEGALVLVRDAWRDFEFQYRVAENRSLAASRLALPAEDTEQLRQALDARFLAGLAERERIAALEEDVGLLEALADPDGGFALRGAGFFAGAPGADAPPRARRALESLRERVADERGPDFLATRRRAAERRLRALAPEDDDTSDLDAYTFSRRYADAHAAILALDVLERALPLRREALRALPGQGAVLGDPERAALSARAERQSEDLARLVGSARPDWGFAFLVGAARLAALAESLESGRLLVLDAHPGKTSRVSLPVPTDEAARHLAWRGERVARARAAVLADPRDTRSLAALGEGAFPRAARVPGVPTARASVAPLPRPDFARRSLTGPLALARARLAASRSRRVQRDRYDLVTRNCVTELFDAVERALAGGAATLSRPASPLAFVPFAAARAVEEEWAPSARRALPSLRRLAAERARREGLLAALRESNTLTSTLYTPHADDSIFLFFADDALLSRPLLGVANLAAGVMGSAAGIGWLPVDGGAMLARGLRGSAASLPELVFVSVRKGTFPLARPVE